MIEKILNDVVIKTALNKALELDPQAAEKLIPLNGKKIAIKLDFRDTPWVFVINDGRLNIENIDMANCDVKLTGSIGGFLQLFRQSKSAVSVNDKLYIEGDLHAAQQFQRMMSDISPDFEYSLKQYFGNQLGGVLNDGLEQVKTLGEKTQYELEQQLKNFFTNGEKGCLTQSEFINYSQRLSALRLNLDRLEAKIRIIT